MTAEEIRKHDCETFEALRTGFTNNAPGAEPHSSIVSALIHMMQAQYEIAAQLAELNHRLQLLSVGNDDAYKSLAVTVVENEDEVL